jgi:outer membrane cobalamin receptor
MKGVFSIVITVILCIPVLAQQTSALKGHISEAKDGQPITGAVIYVASLQQGTESDVNGKYELMVPSGKYEVSVSLLGYETQTKEVVLGSNGAVLNISLNPSSFDLDEVVISSKSEAQLVREKAMPISVVRFDELKGVTGDISDVISKTAGVQIRRSGGAGSQSRISVRGLEGRRIGYFKDGISLGNNEDFDLNQIPVDFIERIEIYKGIVPARFGGNAMGGAVNLVMREYPPTYADIEYKIGSYNTHDITYTLVNNKNGYEFGLGGGYTYSDNNYEMELPLQKGTYITRDHDAYSKFCLGLGFTSKKWWFDEVEFEPLIVHEHREIQGIEYNIEEAEKTNLLLGLTNHIEKTNFFTEGLYFEMNNNFSYANNMFVDSAMTRYGWDGTSYPTITKYGGEIAGYNSNNKVFTVLQHTDFEYTINVHHIVNFNSQYNYSRSLPEDELREKVLGYPAAFNSTMHSWVTGLNYEFNSPNMKFTNSITGRFYYYYMKTKYVPDLGSMTKEPENIKNEKFDYGVSDAMRYKFSPEFLIKGSFAYDLRLPSSEELVGDGFAIEPSEFLDPERNASVNIGFMYNAGYSDYHRFQLEMNFFAMFLKDMIKLSGGALQSKYENFGKMRTLGAELDMKWDATRWLYLWGNTTYQDLRDTRKLQPGSTVANATKGKRIPNIPYFFWNTGFELHKENFFGGKEQNTRMYGDCSFIEEYFYNFELSKNQEKRIPRSFTVNAGVEHSFCNRSFFLKFELKNITDEQIFSELNRPLPGRNFKATVRYIWK